LYSPLSMIFWYESGGNYAKLAVVLLIGVLIVFAYLSLVPANYLQVSLFYSIYKGIYSIYKGQGRSHFKKINK